MFASYVFEKSSAEYTDKLFLIDTDNLNGAVCYSDYFAAHGFQIIRYEDDLQFRVEHDEAIYGTGKYAVIAAAGTYIPYDIRQTFRIFDVSLASLFPKLNITAVKEAKRINYDLLCMAYKKNFKELRQKTLTQQFIENKVFGRENVEEYLQHSVFAMNTAVAGAQNYQAWFRIANMKSAIDALATEYELYTRTEHVNEKFVEWVLASFGKLSTAMNKQTPVLVSRAMEYMRDRSDKFAIVVMDGMSEFDWRILSEGFGDIVYTKSDMFAMIPTTTSVSRQCLLSNKYPSQLQEPWSQSKEKAEFIACASDMGYTAEQIGYERGYDADFGSFVRCAAVIINEIDDTVHGQGQGRIGMFNDVTVMAKQGKLVKLVKRLIKKGFDVYITADHGNTPCTGTGKLMKTGVEVETKSRRMIVLRDFADKQSLIEKHSMIDYPKYYLNKDYDYLICGVGQSFDSKGDEVMNHGGISVDEVIVPFISIKAVENNG